jgi:hypothetical protein
VNLEARTFLWHPADGGPPLNLTDRAGGRRLLAGATGLDMVSYTYSERRAPGRPGAKVTSVRAEPRDIDLPFILQAENAADLRYRTQELVRAMRPTQGPGRLHVIYPTGESRWLTCRYTDGLEGSEARDAKLPGRWYRSTIGLRAEDPYVRTEPITVQWSLAPSGRGWFPIIPIHLTPSGIAGRKTINNPGDVDAYPIIKIHGPGEQLVVRHRGTGRAAHLAYSLPSDGLDAEVTIDTRRGAQSITDGYGNNLFRFLTDEDPSLFPLLPGDNELEVLLQYVSASTTVSVTFDPLFESL